MSKETDIAEIQAEVQVLRTKALDLAKDVRDQAAEIRQLGLDISKILSKVKKIDKGPDSIPAKDFDTLVTEINEVQKIAQNLKNENQS